MSNVNVDPQYLSELADILDEAAEDGREATVAVPEDVRSILFLTHGIASTRTNLAFDHLTKKRKEACASLAYASQALADALRAAGSTYAETDSSLARNLNNEVPLAS